MKRENTFIIYPETIEQENALRAFVKALKINFDIAKERPYDPDFVTKIERSRREYEEGKFSRVKKDELENFLGLK